MKFLLLLFLYTFAFNIKAQDSSKVKPKFTYMEFSINSSNFYRYNFNVLYSNTALNVGVKYFGFHKLTIGVERNIIHIEPNNAIYYPDAIKTLNYNLNFKANYFFYFSKYQKKFNHFVVLNYYRQTVKDYFTNKQTDYEYKKANVYGIGYGMSFYVKKHILIEPSITTSIGFYNNRDVYVKSANVLQTEYLEINKTSWFLFPALNLKLGYIIPFKN